MQIKRLIILFIILFILTSTCSCYDSTEIDDMIYVLSIGIDEKSNYESLYTFQSAIPLNISSGVETGFAQSKDSANLHNISVIATDIYSAIEKANVTLAKELNVSHCKVVIFSKEISASKFKQTVDSINYDSDFRPDVMVSMCDSSANEYLNNISSPFEQNPARYYEDFFKKSFSTQMVYTEINEFEKNNSLVIPVVFQNKEIVSSTIVNNYHSVAELSDNETLAYNILTNKLSKSYVTIPSLKIATSIIKRHTPKISVDISGQRPKFKIQIELSGDSVFFTDERKSTFKHETEKYISQLCTDFLEKTKELNSDVTDLVKYSKIKFLTTKAFNNYNWDEMYKIAEFEVDVNCEFIK